MSVELRFTDRQWGQLREHLLADQSVTRSGALSLAGNACRSDGIVLTTRRVIPMTVEDLDRLHLSISPVALARVTKEARRQQNSRALSLSSVAWFQWSFVMFLSGNCRLTYAGGLWPWGATPRPVGVLALGPARLYGAYLAGRSCQSHGCLRIVGDQLRACLNPAALPCIKPRWRA